MARKVFHGSIPAGLFYDTCHDMWLRPVDDGSVTVGATRYGTFLAGEINLGNA